MMFLHYTPYPLVIPTYSVFLMFAIVCALVASVGVARALGIKSADLDTLSSGIMFANSFVVYTGIKNVRRNRIAIETFEEGIAEFKNGEISEEDFYREWLEGVWIFIDSNYNEIKRMADKKSESATLLYPKRGDR